MGILEKLTLTNLKKNKKRTIAMVISVALSVFLVLTIGITVSSVYTIMLDKTKQQYGEYYVSLKNISKEDLDIIKNKEYISELLIEKNLGYIELQDMIKKYVIVKSIDEENLKELHLLNGNLPQNSNEILISNNLKYYFEDDLKVGSVISLDLNNMEDLDSSDIIDDRNKLDNMSNTKGMENIENVEDIEQYDSKIQSNIKEYKVVGIIENNNLERKNWDCCYIKSNEETQNYDAYIKYKHVNKMCEYTNELINELKINNIDNVLVNTELLNLYGIIEADSGMNEFKQVRVTSEYNFISLVDAIMIFILLIFSVSCIIIIYNSFAVSVNERKRQFGMLSSIGASRKQIMKMVFLEATFIGIIAIIIGIIMTFASANFIFGFVNDILKSYVDYKVEFVFNLKYILICFVFIIMIIYLSALIPAINMGRVSPIKEIMQNKEIKNSHSTKCKFTSGILGIEKSIAGRNTKRNKNKYRVIVFSLSLSMILFMSVSSFLIYQEKLMQLVENVSYDAQIILSLKQSQNEDQEDKLDNENDEIKRNILNFEEIEDYSDFKVMDLYINILDIDKKYFDKIFFNKVIENEIGIPYHKLSVIGLEDKDYRKYIECVDAEYGDNIILNHTYLIEFNTYSTTPKYTYTHCFKNVDDLQFTIYDSGGYVLNNGGISSHSKAISTLENFVITDIENLAISKHISPENIVIYTNMENYNKLYKETYIDCAEKIVNNDGNEENLGYGILNEWRILNLKLSDIIKFNNHFDNFINKQEIDLYADIPELENAQKTLLIKIVKSLSYMVIGIIILIGVASLLNIISTSLQERKQEISILRSIGLSKSGLTKMLFFENLYLFVKSLIISIPISLIINYFIKKSISETLIIERLLIPYKSIGIFLLVICIVFILITIHFAKMVYKENIIENLKY